MRYARAYPYHSQYAGLASEATDPPAQEPAVEDPSSADSAGADAASADLGDATAGNGAGAPPAGAGDEPPLWTTADDHVLHLPPDLIERILSGLGPATRTNRRRRRHPPRVHRRRTIANVGNLVRRARRIGTTRARGLRLPTFRSRVGQRNFRIVTRPRFGLRHEIVSVEPELGYAGEISAEFENGTGTIPEPAKTGVPFAPLPPAGSYWPLQTKHPRAREVSYRPVTGKVKGNAGRVFKAGRTTKVSGVAKARNHCGVDLFAWKGDPVVACEDGTIVEFGFFYNAKSGQRTYKILIAHSRMVINYGEVTPDSFKRTGLKVGMPVKGGQVIGYVSDTGMLHFETYTTGTKSPSRWWKGDPAPSRLLDPTRYLLYLLYEGKWTTAPATPSVPATSTSSTATPTAKPTPKPTAKPRPATTTSKDRELAEALRIAGQPVPGMPGTTLQALVEQWRKQICPEVPLPILIAFVKKESGGKFTDATHGTAANKWTSPDFYELGLFQVPAGLHGHCTGKDATSCTNKPPGQEGKSPSTWARLCRKIGANPDAWTDPTTQVRVGLMDLEEGAAGIRKDYPELFTKRGSDWDIRLSVLYRFSRGGGYARSFLKAFRQQLAALPENQRWTFLRDKSVPVTVTRKGARVRITREFKGGNVEEKMTLAAKLGYQPA
jgi:murein DD-endopeptidase MepM/ murein hydrolase activator NlpD